MEQFTRIAVGEEFTLINNKKHKNQDGCTLEVLSDGGFYLIVFLANMTTKEKQHLRTSSIKANMFKDSSEFKMFTLQYGNSPLIFEIVFNPLLYTDERKDIMFNSNMITIIGVESTTYIIQTLRYANLPKKMFLEIIEQSQKAKNAENYNIKFSNWRDDLLIRYNTLELHERGKYVGKLGEE